MDRSVDRLLVVNADDMGLAEGVNRGIEEALRAGFVRSVSVMAAGEAFGDAVARLSSIGPGGIGIGIHLIGTLRPPVLPPARISGLVGPDGRLPRNPLRLFAAVLRGRARMDEVEAEFDAQVARLVDSGLAPDHLDCHLGLHAFPPILEAALRVARRHGIPFVRRLRVRFAGGALGLGRSPRHMVHALAAASMSGFLDARLARAEGVKTSDAVFGLSRFEDAGGQIRAILEKAGPGLSEFFCHPGRADESTLSLPYRYAGWETELEAVKDPGLGEMARLTGVRLVTYREVARQVGRSPGRRAAATCRNARRM